MEQTGTDEWSCPSCPASAHREKGDETRAKIAEVRALLPDGPQVRIPLSVPQVALARTLEHLHDAATKLDRALAEDRPAPPTLGEEPSPEYLSTLAQLSQVAYAIQETMATSRLMWAEAAASLARYAPSGLSTVDYPGVRPFQPRFPKARKAWDNATLADGVRRFVFERTLDPDTGELVAPAADVVFERLTSIVTVNGSNAKVGGLRAAGIDPDDLCTSEPKDPEVRFL